MVPAKYTCCVYIATNLVNGKIYIGKTVLGMHRRRMTHLSAVRNGQMQPFICALRKYGEAEFLWQELFVAADKYAISAAEIELIAFYRSAGFQLYNVTDGGDGYGMPRTESQKEKMRGRKSDEHRANISAAWTPERRAAQAEKMRTRTVSESTRAKSRRAMLGKKLSPEHIENVRLSKLGSKYRLKTGMT